MPSNLKDTPSGRPGKGRLARASRPDAGSAASHINRMNRVLAEQGREAERLKMEIHRRDRHLVLLHNNLQEILHSRSWRLMAPLRLAGRVYRKSRMLISVVRARQRAAGGIKPLVAEIVQLWRTRGTRGMIAVLRNVLGITPRPAAGAPAGKDRAPEPRKPVTQGSVPEDASPSILFVSHEASRTGAPVLLLDVARLIRDQLGLRCVFLLRIGGELESDFRALGQTVVLRDPVDIDETTLAMLSRQNVRLVYSNTATNGLVQRKLKRLNRPILCHVHELGHSIERHFGGANIRAVLDSTDLFLAGSGAVAGYLLDERKVPAERVTVAYPFINVEANLRRCSARDVPRMPPREGLVVGACGTIGWRKGTDLFLQLAQHVLARTQATVHFVWVGGPLTRVEFAQIDYDAHVMGIRDHLFFPGAVKDHIPYFARFDMFVLTSREDPFPLVAIDAASLGAPVICFDKAGGAPELVETDAGIVVPYMDVEAMADAVLTLAEDAGLRRGLGAAAAAKVRARYDVAASGASIVKLVEARAKQ